MQWHKPETSLKKRCTPVKVYILLSGNPITGGGILATRYFTALNV